MTSSKRKKRKSKVICESPSAEGFGGERGSSKFGLAKRYAHLLNLAKEPPDGPVKDEILDALKLIRQVGRKLDERLKGMTPIEAG